MQGTGEDLDALRLLTPEHDIFAQLVLAPDDPLLTGSNHTRFFVSQVSLRVFLLCLHILLRNLLLVSIVRFSPLDEAS